MLGPDVVGVVEHRSIAFVCVLVANALAALSNKANSRWLIFRGFMLARFCQTCIEACKFHNKIAVSFYPIGQISYTILAFSFAQAWHLIKCNVVSECGENVPVKYTERFQMLFERNRKIKTLKVFVRISTININGGCRLICQ